MRLSSGWPLACVLVALACGGAAAGCTAGGDGGSDAGGAGDSGGGMDAGVDGGGPERCSIDSDCNDSIACTADTCAVGNVCRHTPLDELCATGERCVVGTGCRTGMPSACTVDADCQDGAFCNGPERCVGPAGSRTCVTGTPIDCDDGNACTNDACDEAGDGCSYAIADGCDAGTAVTDGGVPCEPFDPATDYPGTFSVRPTVASSCLRATWTIDNLTFSTSGGALRATAPSFTLTSASVPTGPDFRLEYQDVGCARHELTGTFMCANRFRGTWRVTFEGECSLCGSTSTTTVVGIRR